MPLISASHSPALSARSCRRGGSGPQGRPVAESVVASNLRGVDSHGIQLSPSTWKAAGRRDGPAADGRVVSESGACLVFDGQNAIGQWVAETCCGHAVRLAREQGLAMVVARESNHFGAAAWWAAEDARRRADRHGVVQRLSHRAAVAGQGRAHRHQPICMSRARSLAAGYGHHHGGGGQNLQSHDQREAGDPRGLGLRSARRAHHRHQGRPTTGACSCRWAVTKAAAWP